MSNTNLIIKILTTLVNAFCGGNNKNHQQQQQQQYGQYPAQQNQQQQAYPPQQQYQQYPPQQQQQQYQQQQGQSWSHVAGGTSPQHHQQQQHKPNGQYQSQQQNGGWQSKPTVPAGGVLGLHAPQQNHDQVNATNERYTQLRNQARQEGDLAHKCFAESQQAYQRGDGGKAHDLSVEGKAHQKKQDDLDDEASGWIFSANNQQSPPGTIDLHGLYVKEAIERTEEAISAGQRSGQEELRVIVGKGIHSQGHVAKIKPAVEGLMQKYNLSAHIDPHNTGVLIVDLNGNVSNGRTRDAGGLVDQMGRDQGSDCVIM